MSHNGYGHVSLVDAVPVASHVCVVGRGLSGLVVLEVFEREYDSNKNCVSHGVHLCLFQMLTRAGGGGWF